MYIFKSCRLNTPPLHTIFHNRHAPSQFLSSLGEKLAELRHCRLFADSPVVAPKLRRGFVTLDPSAGFQSGKGLAVKFVPVDDAPEEPANVDEIERIRAEGPSLGAVVDLAEDLLESYN